MSLLATILSILMGKDKYCRTFHKPTYSNTIEWYGGWCRPCGTYFGPDRRVEFGPDRRVA